MYSSVGLRLWSVPLETDDEAILKLNLVFKREISMMSYFYEYQDRQKRARLTVKAFIVSCFGK